MKQKNLILMVVAVGCGLLAAFLTSQMSARPAAAPVQIEALVVAKELPPGTKFTLDSIKDQFKKKMISPDAVPEKAVITEEGLDGKTLNKTLRVDDFLRESDLGNYTPLDPPEGKHVISVRIPVDKMTPFVQPNSKVDIVGTGTTRDGKVKSCILIPNVLVMAIDAKVINPQGGPQGDLNIQLATLAVTRDEAMAIRVAEAANVRLSFILRSDGTKGITDEQWSLAKVTNWINGEDTSVKAEEAKAPPPPETKETTTLSVPVEDLPAGTELTPNVLETKFKDIKQPGIVPDNAVKNIKAHVGHFLQKDVAANFPVPESYIGEKPLAVAGGKGKAGEGITPQIKPGDLPEEKEIKKLPTFDRTYSTQTGTKLYRYEIQESGDWKLLGEVTADGTIVPLAGTAPAAGTPKTDDKEKPAPKRDI